MKALMRGLVWWPGIDTDVERSLKECSPCEQTQPSPPLGPLHPWEWPQHPWSRLHIDFAGPIEGKMLLVVIDAYSKWVEAIPMGSTSAALTIIQFTQTVCSVWFAFNLSVGQWPAIHCSRV